MRTGRSRARKDRRSTSEPGEQRGEETILIVDDEEVNRAILSNLFCTQYTILEAADGLEA
mgnify:CR=1 FL=1